MVLCDLKLIRLLEAWELRPSAGVGSFPSGSEHGVPTRERWNSTHCEAARFRPRSRLDAGSVGGHIGEGEGFGRRMSAARVWYGRAREAGIRPALTYSR